MDLNANARKLKLVVRKSSLDTHQAALRESATFDFVNGTSLVRGGQQHYAWCTYICYLNRLVAAWLNYDGVLHEECILAR